MKKIIYLFISISTVTLFSCSKSSAVDDDSIYVDETIVDDTTIDDTTIDDTTIDDATTTEVGTVIDIVIGTSVPSATRASYSANSDSSEFTFSWHSGDAISIAVPDVALNSNRKFSADSSTSSSSLSGQLSSWEGEYDLYAIFPYSSSYSVSSSSFTHSMASQEVDASSSNSFENGLMVAVASGTTVVSEDDYYIPTLSFMQVMSFYQLSLNDIPEDETIAEIGFEASSDLFVESATVDMTTATISNKTMTSAISASVSGASGTTATLNFALFPVDLSSQAITMYVVTTASEGRKVYSKEFSPAANFERNTFIHHGEELSLSDFDGSEEANFVLSDFSSTSYPEGDVWVIDDGGSPSYEEFEGLREALSSVWENGQQISLSFPNIESFPANALEYMYNLVSISADSATAVGRYTFAYCNNLTSVDLPKVTTVMYSAFENCSKLSTLSLPEVTAVGNMACCGCYKLTTLSLPKVEIMTNGALTACTSLTTLEIATDESSKLLFFGDVFWGEQNEKISLSVGVQSSEYVDGNVLYVTPSSDEISDDDLYRYLLAIGEETEWIESMGDDEKEGCKEGMMLSSTSYTFKDINIVGGVSNSVSASGENASGTKLNW